MSDQYMVYLKQIIKLNLKNKLIKIKVKKRRQKGTMSEKVF